MTTTNTKNLVDELSDFLAGAVFLNDSVRSSTNVEDACDAHGPILERLLKRIEGLEHTKQLYVDHLFVCLKESVE